MSNILKIEPNIIKFKAKNNYGDWVFGLPCFNEVNELCIQEESTHQLHVINGITLSQLIRTDTVDENGNPRDLYKNDIVGGLYETGNPFAYVEWHASESNFVLHDQDDDLCHITENILEWIFICGNVFDNPELIDPSLN